MEDFKNDIRIIVKFQLIKDEKSFLFWKIIVIIK